MGDAHGKMITIIGNGLEESSSNPEHGCLDFHCTNTLEKGINPTILSSVMGK